MPLTPCPYCASAVSDRARSCLTCGYRFRPRVASGRALGLADGARSDVVWFIAAMIVAVTTVAFVGRLIGALAW